MIRVRWNDYIENGEYNMKIVIIGGVAAGTSAAVRARRNSEDAEIIIYDRDVDVAHAGFATHYAVGGRVENMEKLVPYDAQWFKEIYNIDVKTLHEVIDVNPEEKVVRVKNLETNEEFEDQYDTLVFANGAVLGTPPVFRDKSFSNVFRIKTVQYGRELQKYIDEVKPKTAVVIGAGYIGLGVSEQLTNAGLKVRTLDFLKYPMAQLDHDISTYIADILEENGVTFHGNEGVTELQATGEYLDRVITSRGNEYEADMYIVATGVRPNTELAESIGVEIGETRAIKVNEKMQTNIKDIYAVGDVAEAYHAITKKPIYLPLATTASKMGRIAGDVITGGDLTFKGILGTSVVRLFGNTIAGTGMTETRARQDDFEPVVLTSVQSDYLSFMGGENMIIKAIAHPETERLLGFQIIGPSGVERRIDVLATAMTANMKASELFDIDLAFTPPVSTPKDPVMYTGMALTNAIKNSPLMTAEEMYHAIEDKDDIVIIDVRDSEVYENEHLENSINIPLKDVRSRLVELDPNKRIAIYCNSGRTSYTAQRILLNRGFKEVYNLTGGLMSFKNLLHDLDNMNKMNN